MACAVRELREETGIESLNLIEIGRVIHHLHKSIYVEYLCATDVKKNSIILQEGETQDYKWVNASELRSMTREQLATSRILNLIDELKQV